MLTDIRLTLFDFLSNFQGLVSTKHCEVFDWQGISQISAMDRKWSTGVFGKMIAKVALSEKKKISMNKISPKGLCNGLMES